MMNMNYGLQLFSVRDAAAENFEGMLKAVAEMGYTMVESAGFFGHSAKEVKAMLDAYGLTLCSTHTGCGEVFDRLSETIAFHQAVGCRDIIIPGAPWGNREEIDYTVNAINRVLPIIEAEGLRLHYHNHSGEFLPNRDGLIAEDAFIERTGVLLEIDTFWAYHAGVDPVQLMETYKDRIRFIHLKDGISDSSHAIGKSLGLGKAPVLAVREKAIELGMTMVVESEGLDPTGLEESKRCIDFLKTLS